MSELLADKYSKVGTTYFAVEKSNVKDKIEVEIGDSKQAEFYPQVKLLRWDNEVNFSARLIDDLGTDIPSCTLVGDKIVWNKIKTMANFYSLPPTEELPEGGFEFEITIKSKPKTNVVTFSIQHKGLEFYYQPALTTQEISNGDFRPDNVINSYAVYYKNCPANRVNGKSYRSGKAFHLYRPKITDAVGSSVWGDLFINNNTMTVTIPQTFINKCVYPITHAAGLTFGYTTAGASITAGGYTGSLFTGASGTLDKITASMRRANTNAFSVYVSTALYLHSDLSKVAQTQTRYQFLSLTQEWYDFTAASESISAVDYVVTIGKGSNAGSVPISYYDAGDADQGHVNSTAITNETPLAMASTFPTVTHSTNKYSVYATYTAGGGTTYGKTATATVDMSYSKLLSSGNSVASTLKMNTMKNMSVGRITSAIIKWTASKLTTNAYQKVVNATLILSKAITRQMKNTVSVIMGWSSSKIVDTGKIISVATDMSVDKKTEIGNVVSAASKLNVSRITSVWNVVSSNISMTVSKGVTNTTRTVSAIVGWVGNTGKVIYRTVSALLKFDSWLNRYRGLQCTSVSVEKRTTTLSVETRTHDLSVAFTSCIASVEQRITTLSVEQRTITLGVET